MYVGAAAALTNLSFHCFPKRGLERTERKKSFPIQKRIYFTERTRDDFFARLRKKKRKISMNVIVLELYAAPLVHGVNVNIMWWMGRKNAFLFTYTHMKIFRGASFV